MVPTCQYCDRRGHTAKTCYRLHGYPTRPEAHSVTAVTPNESAWLVDSGASHHVTKDMGSLSISNEYAGTDQLMAANGKGLPITHVGSTHISTNSHSLQLSNILHVPTVSHNLLSVSQLCQTNDVSVEFFPWHFDVKDLQTGAILLRGRNEDNVYKLRSLPSPPQSHHACPQPTLHLWHHRLGHPTSRILHHTLKANHLTHSTSSLPSSFTDYRFISLVYLVLHHLRFSILMFGVLRLSHQ
ncbi:hypothetical protein V8G54_033483 [Vigna mungo]|uniref:Retrovirus-related Pol polyprotein from transposon TNT 1-94-like beta-barrel domain-containing protein n=1 Tax=Vigna mungo TaxID=3915 RepID=A0AAQ3MP15_VIGMU